MSEALDLTMLEQFVPEGMGRSHYASALCAALELDFEEMLTTGAEVFCRRRAMASEHYPEIADAIAIVETFLIGIAYGQDRASNPVEST